MFGDVMWAGLTGMTPGAIGWGRRRRLATRSPRKARRLAVLTALMCVGLAAPAEACTTIFQPASGSWGTAGNWSTGVVPGAGDDVCVPAGRATYLNTGTATVSSLEGAGTLQLGGGTLSLSNGASSIGTLTMGAGTLDGAGDLTVSSGFSWSSGTMAGTGVTTIAGGVVGSLSGFPTLARRLVNNGSLVASGSRLVGASGAVLDNAGAFTHNMSYSNGWGMNVGAGTKPTLLNRGIFRRTAGGGGQVDWAFENSGEVQMQAGTMYFFGGGAGSGGSWSGAGTSVLGSGTFAFTARATVDGVLRVGASVQVGELQGDGEVAFEGGSLSITDATAVSHIKRLTSVAIGTLAGAGDLVVDSVLTWKGTMSGTGRTIVAPEATGSIAGGTLARTLVNRGTLTAAGSSWYGTSAAVLDNQAMFTTNIPINNGMGMRLAAAGATPQIRNSGTFRTTLAAPSVTTVEWQIDNAARVESAAGAGTVYFSGGGVPGTSSAGAWSRVQLTAGNHAWGAGTTLTGPVAVMGGQVSAPDLQGADGDLTVTGSTLTLTDATTTSRVRSLTMGPTAATLTGAGNLTISGTLNWTIGTMSGSGTTTLAEGASGSIGGGSSPVLARTLINHAALTAHGNFSWKGTSAALFENYGTSLRTSCRSPAAGWRPRA
jgi:hypothetical protein